MKSPRRRQIETPRGVRCVNDRRSDRGRTCGFFRRPEERFFVADKNREKGAEINPCGGERRRVGRSFLRRPVIGRDPGDCGAGGARSRAGERKSKADGGGAIPRRFGTDLVQCGRDKKRAKSRASLRLLLSATAVGGGHQPQTVFQPLQPRPASNERR